MLIFDVGSGSVGGAIVLTSAIGAPSILYSFRSDIVLQAEITGRRLLSHMLRSLGEVVAAIGAEGFRTAGFGTSHPSVSEIFVSLSAPWVLSKTSFLSLHNEKPEVLTPAIFNELLAHAHSDDAISGRGIKGSIEVERKLMKTMLNGYETSEPYERRVSQAEFAVRRSFSVARVTEAITDTITRVVHSKHFSLHSFSLLAFAVFRELFPEEENFLVVDVSGEQTEVSVAKKSVLSETATIPFGRNSFLRALEDAVSAPSSGTSTLVKLYTKNHSVGPLAERAARICGEQKKLWAERLFKALSDFSAEPFLPRRVFLTADDDVTQIFADAILEAGVTGTAASAPAFEITTLQNDVLGSLARWSPSHAPDPFMSVIASVANRARR